MLPSQTRIPVNLKLLEEIFKAAKKKKEGKKKLKIFF